MTPEKLKRLEEIEGEIDWCYSSSQRKKAEWLSSELRLAWKELERLLQKNRLYKKQIKELQSALLLKATMFDAEFFRAQYYQNLAREIRASGFLSDKIQDQIMEEMKKYYAPLGYELRKNKRWEKK